MESNTDIELIQDFSLFFFFKVLQILFGQRVFKSVTIVNTTHNTCMSVVKMTWTVFLTFSLFFV